MEKGFKQFLVSSSIIVPSFIYLMLDTGSYQTFRKGLQFKVECAADKDRNGLSIEEMAEVFNRLGLNPNEQLRSDGFYLTQGQCQVYLGLMGELNPETDITPKVGREHPYYTQGIKEGKIHPGHGF